MLITDAAFEWSRCGKGYIWTTAPPTVGLRRRYGTQAVLIATTDGDAVTYCPFVDEPDLFLRINQDHEAMKGEQDTEKYQRLAAFTDRYGLLLNRHESSRREGTSLLEWRLNTLAVTYAVGLWRALTSGSPTQLRTYSRLIPELGLSAGQSAVVAFTKQPTPDTARRALTAIINGAHASLGDEGVTALRLETTPRLGFEIIVRPSSLLAAAWLQLVQAVQADARCRDCPPPCGRTFVLMPGDHSNRTYCSASCKQRAWRLGNTAPQRLMKSRKRGKRGTVSAR
jgi:hypothetical protein